VAEQGVSQGFEIAQRALDELRTLGLEPSITNFAVWTTHLGGANEQLSLAVEHLRTEPMRLNDAAVQALYFQHLLSASEELLDLGEIMSEHLKRATTALSDAGATTARYGEALDGASIALKTSVEPHVLQSLVKTLVQATRNMRERTRELEVRLTETSGEVRSLRTNLTKAREESLTDPLTGAANRKRFDEFLETARAEALKTKSPLALVLCDIDKFKKVNDSWGHHTGDQVIRFIVSALKTSADEGHLVARYGGEEFAIVAPNCTIEEASKIAERARHAIESKVLKRRTTNEYLGHVTASFGVALFEGKEPRWRLVERADAALYASKEAGRNRVTAQAA
jgi:diguanylate cyclase